MTWTLADSPRARTWAKVTELFSYGIWGNSNSVTNWIYEREGNRMEPVTLQYCYNPLEPNVMVMSASWHGVSLGLVGPVAGLESGPEPT